MRRRVSSDSRTCTRRCSASLWDHGLPSWTACTPFSTPCSAPPSSGGVVTIPDLVNLFQPAAQRPSAPAGAHFSSSGRISNTVRLTFLFRRPASAATDSQGTANNANGGGSGCGRRDAGRYYISRPLDAPQVGCYFSSRSIQAAKARRS